MDLLKKNTKIRNILLVLILVCTAVFFIIIIGSFLRYRDVQKKIYNVYNTLTYTSNEYNDIYALYNESEYYFRLFSIDFDPVNLEHFKDNLTTITYMLDSLTSQTNLRGDLPKPLQIRLLGEREKLVSSFIELKQQISQLLDLSKDLDTYAEEVKRGNQPSVGNPISAIDSTINTKDKYVVIKRKPLLKRLFKNKDDTIRLSEVEKVKELSTEITRIEQEKSNRILRNTEQKLNELRNSYEELRATENKLLTLNFEQLYQIEELINFLQTQEQELIASYTQKEVDSLLKKSQQFRHQIIISALVITLMLAILIYYQFYTSYYQQKLMQEKAIASKKAEEKANILAEITHEIRTPINSLIGVIDVLKSSGNTINEDQDNLLNSVYVNIQKTSQTVDDILNLSKIEQNSDPFITKFDIHRLAKEIHKIHQSQAWVKNIDIDLDFTKDSPLYIKSDEFRIKQIITNLLSNAIKYSGPDSKIKYRVDVKDETLTIEIQDQGIGISNKIGDSIFKKFYTAVKDPSQYNSVGLGLYITNELVQSLSGKISYKSKLKHGTTFTVEIPTVTEKALKSELVPDNNTIKQAAEKFNWLIVDDNQINLLYIQQHFTKTTTIKLTHSVKEALSILKKEPIDIIITDINMPLMSGGTLLKKIKSSDAWKKIIVIATSADYDQILKIEKQKELKFDLKLMKPFTNDSFYNILFRGIEKRKKQIKNQ